MIVGVMRHARAEPKSPGLPDSERRLTEEGRRQAESIARLLPWRPSRIVSSPYRRALETAEVIARETGAPLEVSELLAPDSFNLEAFKKLAADGVLLVGHAPSVEEVVGGILGCRVKMKTASVAVMEVEGDGSATLLALLLPPGSKL
ncbi:MAG: histidine phosphatase family protein [Desulfurococcales archaeon]|nr:histidine phosphatase family protein [Desulfurococcales archaeon]